MNTVAIMQPTYLGWAGYFSMIDQADTFLLLDTVAIDRKSWQTRNRILGRDNEVVWLSVPVSAHMEQRLDEVEIAGDHWRRKHSRSLESAYGHLPYFGDLTPILIAMSTPWRWLGDLTSLLVHDFSQVLGIKTEIRRAPPTESQDRIGRIAELCRQAGATEFLATPGATFLHGLEEISPGIPIRWHEYEPVPYEQNGGPFISHLSVVDALARLGPEETLDLVRSGRRVAVVR